MYHKNLYILESTLTRMILENCQINKMQSSIIKLPYSSQKFEARLTLIKIYSTMDQKTRYVISLKSINIICISLKYADKINKLLVSNLKFSITLYSCAGAARR